MMIYCVHEHELLPGVDVTQYEHDVAQAIATMKIPGLLHSHHLKGIGGVRSGRYAVLWVFANEEALLQNFGGPRDQTWPADWLHYEDGVLAPYLDRHGDKIDFTDYRPLCEVAYAK